MQGNAGHPWNAGKQPGTIAKGFDPYEQLSLSFLRGDTMQRSTLSGMILGLMLFCSSGVLLASEADELRERAKALRKEAAVNAERGNQEIAERLAKEAAELLEAAERLELKAKGGEKGDRPGIDMEIRQLKERLQDLLARERKMREEKAPEQELAEVRERIAATERELREIHAHHAERSQRRPEHRVQVEKLEATARRIHHLRVAAENLKMAEAHDLARQLLEKAEILEREAQEARQRLAAERREGHEHGAEQGPDAVRELRAEIERLRAEVKELRQLIEKR